MSTADRIKIVRTLRRSLGLALLLCMALARPAQSQLVMGGQGSLPPVMQSKDFEALVKAVALDEAQRQSAGALFDDAQQRMFEACAQAREGVRPAAAGAPDRRTLADEEQRRRALSAQVLQAASAFFEGLGALVRAEQHEALDRERLAAERRLMRALMREESTTPVAKHDLERAVEMSKLSPDSKAAALAALASYRQRLAPLYQRMLNEALDLPGRVAAEREANEKSGQAPVSTEPGVPVRDTAARERASGAYHEVLDQVAEAHRDAFAAIEGALGAAPSDQLRAEAYTRLWPRCGTEGGSPRHVFTQLDGRTLDESTARAVAAVRSAWLQRWWPIAMRMTKLEDTLRRAGVPLGGSPTRPGTETRAQLRALRDERALVNRDAWRALAAADPAHRDFYEEQAKALDPATRNPNDFMGNIHPQLPADAAPAGAVAASGAPGGDAVVAATGVELSSMSTAMIAISSSDGDTDFMVFEADASGDGGAFGITFSPDGGPVLLGDQFGDGMNDMGDSGFSFTTAGDSMAGAHLPSPISRQDLDAIAPALRLPPDNATLAQIYQDYLTRTETLDKSQGEEIRRTLAGSSVKVEWAPDQGEEAPVENIKTGIGKMDAMVTALAEADDALLNAAGAAGGVSAVEIARVSQERARSRLRQLGYPATPFGGAVAGPLAKLWLLSVLRSAALSDTDQKAAEAAFDQWSPVALAAVEAARATQRAHCIDIIQHERQERQRRQEAAQAQGAEHGAAVAQAITVDAGAAPAGSFGAKMEEVRAAKAVLERQVIAGHATIAAALSPAGQALFNDAWNRAAAPSVYLDNRNALPKLEAALRIPTLSPEQHRQLEALRLEHLRRHAELCNRIAELAVERLIAAADARDRQSRDGGGAQAVVNLRFERGELNASTLRRLRSLLGADLAATVAGL